MTGLFTLYINGPTKDRNAIIEDIGNFLEVWGAYRAKTITFQRIELHMTIDISIVQGANTYTGKTSANYCSIALSSFYYYFFIDHAVQVSPSSVRFFLTMDTLNTFEGKYSFGPTSRTIRRHKDRFKKVTSGGVDYMVPIFDEKDEGVEVPLIMESDEEIRQRGEPTSYPAPIWYKIAYASAEDLTANPPVRLGSDYFRVGFFADRGFTTQTYSDHFYLHIDGKHVGILPSLYNLDRTKSEIIKVTRIPYCPVQVTGITLWTYGPSYEFSTSYSDIDDRVVWSGYNPTDIPSDLFTNFDSSVTDDYGVLLPRTPIGESVPPRSTDRRFSNQFADVTLFDPGSKFGPYDDDLLTDEFDDANGFLDPKLYTSPFYLVKFAFLDDYFSVSFEDVEVSGKGEMKIALTQYVSTNIDGDVMITGELSGTASLRRQTRDYQFVMSLSAQNEVPLISSAYVDYMRNGYNYDVSAIKRNEATRWVSTSIQLAGGIAALAASGMTGGISSVAGISLITTAAASIFGNTMSSVNERESMQKRLKTAALQTPSVSTSNSGLTFGLNNGLVHKFVYVPDEDVIERLNRFFHLYGYVTEEYGDPTEFLNSRYWFNFVMGDYEIVKNAATLVSPYPPALEYEVISELKARYREGVTKYHKRPGAISGYVWDYSQRYNNMEVIFTE